MKTLFNRNRRLELEQFEDRRVMAGFVQASISGGDLVLTGDWRQNEIVIYKGAEPNRVVISGIDSGNGATRVNGKLLPVVLNGFTGDVVGNMYAGSDRIYITNLNIPGSVRLNTQQGNDHVLLLGAAQFSEIAGGYRLNTGAPFPLGGPLNVSESVVIKGAEGFDTVRVQDTTIGGDVELHGGDTYDHLSVGGTDSTHFSQVAGNVRFFPGADSDVSITDYVKINGNLEVHDTVASPSRISTVWQYVGTVVKQDVNIFTSPFSDTVGLEGSAGNYNINTYGSADYLEIKAKASGVMHIITGDGNDIVRIFSLETPRLSIDTGTGNDEMNITDSAIGQVFAVLGDGNDDFSITGTTIKKSAQLHGGRGTNRYFDLGGNEITELGRENI